MMPTITLNRACSRCTRMDQTEVDLGKLVELAKRGTQEITEPDALCVVVDGAVAIKFQVLCPECRAIVGGYIEQAARTLTKESPRRKTRQKEG